jgi:predicted anti-sigma-YlaC factor YlaD
VPTFSQRRAFGLLATALVVTSVQACSVRKWAAGKVGDALASGGSTYASDNDAELVGDALPFALKTIEGLLEATPRHEGLLFSAASGFAQYAYVYLAMEADYAEEADLARAPHLRARATNLYRRAFQYGMRGLEVDHPGLRRALDQNARSALAAMKKEDVALLYWTSAAWSLEIASDKTNPSLAVNLPLAEALMHRALELDPGFGDGVIYDYYISYEGGRAGAAGGSIEKAREAFAKSLELAKGRRAAPYLALAESVSVGTQDRKEFTGLLDAALALNVDAAPEYRLANIVAQQRARWLLSRIDDLFVE